MDDAGTDTLIRRAIAGDQTAISRLVATAGASGQAVAMALAAVLTGDTGLLPDARRAAGTSRERQVVEIAAAALRGDRARVDELARDHLADHPGSVVVAWLASELGLTRPGDQPR